MPARNDFIIEPRPFVALILPIYLLTDYSMFIEFKFANSNVTSFGYAYPIFITVANNSGSYSNVPGSAAF